MDFYLKNPNALKQFFPQDDDGYAMVALGFYFSFHFPDGYRADYRRRAAEVCADYWQLCGEQLRWMVTPLKCLWQPIPAGYAMEQWLAAYPNADWVWSMIFHSGRIASEAATYQIVGAGDSTRTHGYSALVLCVPADWFATHPSPHPIALYQRWAELLQARHGTAGFGLIPPEDTPKRGRTSAIAAAFGKQFPGIELVDIIGNRNVFSGLLSANWLNMIDADCIAAIGGSEGIHATLADEPLGRQVMLHPYPGGLILSSGETPLLCENSEVGRPPLAYGPVARLLKPLRTPEPWGCWGCPSDESLNWLARFD